MRAAKLRRNSGGAVTPDELVRLLEDMRDRAAAPRLRWRWRWRGSTLCTCRG